MTDSILYQYRFISEKSLNGHGTLFGGTAMEWMDEAAYIVHLTPALSSREGVRG